MFRKLFSTSLVTIVASSVALSSPALLRRPTSSVAHIAGVPFLWLSEREAASTNLQQPTPVVATAEPTLSPQSRRLFSAAQTAFRSGDYQAAIDQYTAVLKLASDYAPAYNNRGFAYINLGQYDRAVADLNEALQLRPDYAAAYNNRGLAYDNLGRYEQAMADLNEALRLNPDYADAYYNRGMVYKHLGQYEQATADYSKVIGFDPTDFEAYNNRGNAYADLEQYDTAIADYTEAIRLSPDFALAYNNRGLAYDNLGHYEQAIDDYSAAIRLDPRYARAYYNRGLAYDNLGRYEQAIGDYNRAIRLNPDYGDAYLNRAIDQSDLGNPEAAAHDFMQWIVLNQVKQTTLDAAPNGKPITVEMYAGSVYQINFQALSGDRFSAVAGVDPDQPVDTLLVLLGPDGTPVTADDDGGKDGGSVIKDYVLPQTDRYTLVLSHAGGPSEGRISLSIRLD